MAKTAQTPSEKGQSLIPALDLGAPYYSRLSARSALYTDLHVLLDAVSRVPDEVWGEDSVLLVFGGNLEHQSEAFQEEFKRLT